MAETDLKGALEVAEEIRANVEAARIPTADRQTMTAVTISIGVTSIVPDDRASTADFISKADELLYAAKEGGRNRVCSGAADPVSSPRKG
jgi:diguanylate cyclase (GGDEF)-like protein